MESDKNTRKHHIQESKEVADRKAAMNRQVIRKVTLNLINIYKIEDRRYKKLYLKSAFNYNISKH